MRFILTGANGRIGQTILKHLVEHHDVEEVAVMTQRPLLIAHEKLRTIFVRDFADYSSVRFDNFAAAFWAMGPASCDLQHDDDFLLSTDYARNAARALFESSPQARFYYYSPLAEMMGSLFLAMKKRAELELTTLGSQVVRVATRATFDADRVAAEMIAAAAFPQSKPYV